MNYDNLHELINRYENSLDMIYDVDHDELFKWKALKTWREEWFKPQNAFLSFEERFTAAKKDFSVFIDNSRMHPSAGVLKLWEKEPNTVENLFYNVLFAEHNGDVSVVQNNMDSFLDGYEVLREKYFPKNWSYKQDRHSVSVYLAMNDPDFNYAYKSSEANDMARYTGFGFSIGKGENFRLEYYYRLCEEIVSALKEHKTLLEKHFDRLKDGYYVDESLHLLAFDLMYCSRTYSFYRGLMVPVTGIRKAKTQTSKAKENAAQREAEKQARIAELEQEITDLELSYNGVEDISLVGVQVSSPKYGIGTVVEQKINQITVRFDTVTKAYILDIQYKERPRFENDEDIVAAFTQYGRAQQRIENIRREINVLR